MLKVNYKVRHMLDQYRCIDKFETIYATEKWKTEGTNLWYFRTGRYTTVSIAEEDIINIVDVEQDIDVMSPEWRVKISDLREGPKYDPVTHQQLDNFVRDGYKDNEYANVFFRINTKGFNALNGSFLSTSNRAAFQEEAYKIFENLGFEVSGNYLFRDNKEYLYIHPLNISGFIKKNDIEKIANTLALKGKLIFIRWVDVYNDVMDWSDEEYKAVLEDMEDEIRKYIFESCKTSRTSNFVSVTSIYSLVSHKFHVERLVDWDKCDSWHNDSVIINFTNHILEELTKYNYMELHENEGQLYYRSKNKTELKKLHLVAV